MLRCANGREGHERECRAVSGDPGDQLDDCLHGIGIRFPHVFLHFLINMLDLAPVSLDRCCHLSSRTVGGASLSMMMTETLILGLNGSSHSS